MRMSTQNIGSINRVFDIIEQLQKMNGAGVTELSDRLNMPKSTVHSHLKTLYERGYVDRDADGSYHPGLQFLALGGTVREYRTIFKLVRPLMMDLADETGESVTYFIENNGKLVVVGSSMGENAIK